jgi:general secretion pathway protein K
MAVQDAGVRRNRQQGVALITALLVVAMAVVAATAMATRMQVDVRRAANLLHGEQAYAYALSAESWAFVILREDAGNSTHDALDEDWATALPPISVEGGLVSGRVTDLQGRFNVNNLVKPDGTPDAVQVDYFRNLLTVLGLDPLLAAALVDWIDEDINATFPGGAEDDLYLLQDPPYRAANRPLVSVSELLLVQGYTDEVVAALAPHVTALPAITTINVNTATAAVLQALDPKLTAEDVETLLAEREQKPFTDHATFLAHPSLAGVSLDLPTGISSSWFQVLTDVQVGSGQARVESLLERGSAALRVHSRVRSGVRLIPPA